MHERNDIRTVASLTDHLLGKPRCGGLLAGLEERHSRDEALALRARQEDLVIALFVNRVVLGGPAGQQAEMP